MVAVTDSFEQLLQINSEQMDNVTNVSPHWQQIHTEADVHCLSL